MKRDLTAEEREWLWKMPSWTTVRGSEIEEKFDLLLSEVEEMKRDIESMRDRLMWIADPTYIGSYSYASVIAIYRRWARDGLEKLEKM